MKENNRKKEEKKDAKRNMNRRFCHSENKELDSKLEVKPGEGEVKVPNGKK